MAAMFAATSAAVAQTAQQQERARIEAKWQARIQSFLDRGIIPLIDLESSLRRKDGRRYLADALPAMDKLGVALIAFDGKFKPKKPAWGYYIHKVVDAYPDRFILATNGGTNKDWTRGGTAYLEELERQVRTGAYPIMGEIEFRHYMSGKQCKKGRTDRDVDVAIDGTNGHRVFRLSAQTGIPFAIHHEAEDRPVGRTPYAQAATPLPLKANLIDSVRSFSLIPTWRSSIPAESFSGPSPGVIMLSRVEPGIRGSGLSLSICWAIRRSPRTFSIRSGRL